MSSSSAGSSSGVSPAFVFSAARAGCSRPLELAGAAGLGRGSSGVLEPGASSFGPGAAGAGLRSGVVDVVGFGAGPWPAVRRAPSRSCWKAASPEGIRTLVKPGPFWNSPGLP